MSEIEDVLSVPLQLPNPKKGDKFLMNEFIFDLQRFADYTITAGGEGVTFSGPNGWKTFSVTNGTETKNYKLATAGTSVVSVGEDGIVRINVTSGFVNDLTDTDNNQYEAFILTGGSTRMNGPSRLVILGEGGPLFNNIWSSFSSNYVDITLTPYTDYNTVKMSCSFEGYSIKGFSLGGIKYEPAKATSTKPSTIDLKIKDGKTYIDVAQTNTATIQYQGKTFTPSSGAVTLAMDNDGSGAYVTGLENGDSFKLGDVTYTKGKVRLTATYGGVTKFWNQGVIDSTTEVLLSKVDFDSENFSPVMILTDGVLNISSSNNLITQLGSNSSIALFGRFDSSDTDYCVSYGALHRTTTDGVAYYELTGLNPINYYEDDGVTVKCCDRKFTSVTVENGMHVSFNAEVCGVPITVYGTTFASTDSVNSFTYTSLTGGAVSVVGATSVSLLSGLLQTDDSTQTIEADVYSISGYGDTTSANDGINVSLGSSGVVVVGDVDEGEYFTDGTSNYTLTASGLLQEKNGTYYLGRGYVGSNPAAVSLGTDGSLLIEPDSSKILEIGTTNTNGLVFNSKTNPTTGYAEISSSSGNHTLGTLSGNDVGTFSSVINTISLTGGATTIYKDLVLNNVTITTSSSTTFIVTAAANDTFTVSSGTANNPTVTGATALTLLGGSMTAQAGQTIKLGASGKELALLAGSADMTIVYNANASTFTVTAPATPSGNVNGNFTFNGNTYSVDDGNGLTFTIDSSDNVTVGEIDTGDVFSYNSTAYSLKPAGFFKGTTPSYYIWDRNNSHYLSNSSVAASDLGGNYWDALAIVEDDDSIILSPNSSAAGILVDENFTKTYGTLTKGSNSYSLKSSAENTGTLSTVSIDSGTTPFTLSADGTHFLQNVTIAAPNSSLSITEATNNTYQVVLDGSGGNTSLVGAKKATLIKGTLTADSNISSGVVVNGDTVIAGEVVTLTTDSNGTNAAISGLSYNENFSVNSAAYTFTGAGLRNGNQLLRGSKSTSSENNSLPLSSITSGSGWVGLLAVDPLKGVSISGSSSITDVFLVDDFGANVQPTKLYGELLTGASGGYSLTNDGTYDEWAADYKITVDATTVTLSGGFKGSSIVGAKSGASFTADTLTSGATNFTVSDSATGGASLSNVLAINQTGGLVAAAASGIQSVTANGKTVYNTSGLPLDVKVDGSDATLSALDVDDTFIIDSTTYSVTGLGLVTDTQILKSSSISGFNSAVLSEVADTTTDDWIYIAAVGNSLFSIPPEVGSNSWLVLNETRDTRYAQLTGSGSNYSITKDTNAWDTNNTIQVGGGNTLSLTSDFKDVNVSVESSGAVFSVSDNDSYFVTDAATGGAVIGNAKTINQSAGTIALSDSNQSIVAGGHSVSGAGDTVAVVVSSGSASVNGLDAGESFNVDDTTYKLLGNGRLQRQDRSIWDGNLIATTNGSVGLDSLSGDYWKGAIETDARGNFTIGTDAANTLQSISSAFVVNSSDATNIYGTLGKNGNTYALNTTGRTSTLNTVTFTKDMPASLTSDFANISLTAGSNRFMATRANNGYTVNYNDNGLKVDTAAVVSLMSGALILDNVNSAQTIMANNQSVASASESVNVKRSGTTVAVDGIETAGESVKVNRNTYTLNNAAGGGFVVKVSGSSTTVEDLTVGDQFKIDDITFNYTSAGLAKTASGSSTISYLLRAIRPAGNKLSLANLQSTSDSIWLGVKEVTSGEVVINTDIANSVVLVDSSSAPTKNYGQIVRDNSGNYSYIKYDGTVSDAIAETFEEPTSITVGENVTATIASDFSSKPVKAEKATSITVTDSSSDEHTVSGTIEKFIPATMTFTPATGDEFTLEDVNYEMTGAGLTKPDEGEIWTAANVSNYVLPNDDGGTWSTLLNLTSANVLDLGDTPPEPGNNVVVDSTSTTRYATLTYTEDTATYALRSVGGNAIPTIQTDDGDATFTTNFATTFVTGNGTYTINKKAYTGEALEIDATSGNSSLKNGTVTIAAGAQAVTPTDDNSISVTSGSITAEAVNGKWSEFGNLTDGDTFVINNTTYKVYGDYNLAKLNSNGEPEKLYVSFISNGKLNYNDITSNNYKDLVKLNENNQLDLTSNLGITEAFVVGQTNGAIDPTNRIAQLNYDNETYTLSQTTRGNAGNMVAVLLGTEVKTFDTALSTTVLTEGTDTFTINGNPFVATTDLTVVTENGGALLTSGQVTLAKDASVITRYNDGSNHDETITSTNGTLTITVDSSAATVTIGSLDAGDALQVGTNSYTMTSIGLTDGNNLNIDAAANGSITTADLTAGDWKAIVPAPSGVVTLNSSVASNAFVANVDTDNPTAAVKYGTLSKSGSVYTLTQSSTDSQLAGIVLDNVSATLPTTCTDTPITAQGATFTVTATRAFTINATTSALAMRNVRALTLTAGTIQATNNNIPITANGNVITSTSGTMTVGIDDGGVFVGGLDADETFTVGETVYKMTSSGLLDTTNQRLAADVTETFYLGGGNFNRIIAADGSTLDLTNETANAEVYDSISDPKTHMATLTVSGGTLNLTNVDGGISTINLAKDAKLTTDFAATVNTSGETTINGVAYGGTTDLVIDATATTSTLRQGTITLNSDDSIQATRDTTPLEIGNGTLTARATNGRFTHLANLDSGDEFTFEGETYTQTAIGLLSSENKLNPEIETSTTISGLSSGDWQEILQATDGALAIDSSTGAALVVDITDDKSQCKRYGTLTKSGGAFTLTLEEDDSTPASVQVDGVKVTLSAECEGVEISANDVEFSVTASELFTVDATAEILTLANVETVSLTSGTIQAENNIPITANGNVITSTSGTMTVGIDNSGVFVGGLNADETFTVGDTTYKMTSSGLLDTTNQRLAADVTKTYYLGGGTFNRIIAADGSTLDLSNETANAEVYDSISDPKTHMATLTVSGGALNLTNVEGGISTINLAKDAKLTTDFAATVNTSGETTINGVAYSGTTDLVIDATATTSTLKQATITLNDGDSIQATKDSTPLSVTNGTLTARATNGRFTHLANLDSGDEFTFDGKTYTQTAIGLLSSENKLNPEIETSTTISGLSSGDWQEILQATDGALAIDSSTGAALVVDITDDKAQCKRYGTLTKSGGAFTLTLEENDSKPASVKVDGVKVTLPAECAGLEISANDVEFSVTASEPFTVDATAETLTLANVETISLTAGTIQAENNIPITASGNVITSTSGTMTVGIDNSGVFVGGLNADETFTVGETVYKMTSSGLLDTTNQRLAADVTETYYLGGGSFNRIIAADGSTLDLSNETANAEVYDSIENPKTHMATLTVSGGALTLTNVDGGISTINLAKDAKLTTDFAATVNTSGETTINGETYSGTTDLVIDATATTSTLKQGTITLNGGDSIQATRDTTPLEIGNGTLTARATNGRFTHLANLDSGDEFTFEGETYTQTAIGLLSSENKLNPEIETSTTISGLSSGDWQEILQATDGALAINSDTGAALVVDITDDKSQCKRYGTLTKSGGAFTLTLEEDDSTPASVQVDGLKVTLPAECEGVEISANDVEFSVTASEPFTVDATAEILTLVKVETVSLTSGTIQAENNIPITAGGNTITSTSGTMTVGIDDSGVFVGGLNADETFTVGDTTYKMTSSGLLDTTNQRLAADVTETFYLGGGNFNRIIAADGSTLDLSNETANAEVYDSISDPKTHMATLTVSGGALNLTNVNGGISTINLAKDAKLTTDFAATVNTSGETTINGVTYSGTTDLIIDATATTSALKQGTITLNDGDSIQATKDSTPLSVTNGTLTARATNGRFTHLANLDSGDEFTFEGETYTQSPVGLVNGSKISEDLAGKSIQLSNLTVAKWNSFLAPSGGVLNLTEATESALILDSTTVPTTKLADLIVISSGRFSLAGTDEATAIEAVTLPQDSTLDVDFATKAIAPQGSVHVNAKSYNAAGEVIIDSDGTTSTLYDGTVILDTDNPSCTDTNSSVLEIVNGSITGTAQDGSFAQLGDVNPQESFTLDGNTYTQSAVGLMKDGKLSENLAGETISIERLNAAVWKDILVPRNNELNLSGLDGNYLICDDNQNPTVIYATLAADDDTFTLRDNDNAEEIIKNVNIDSGSDLTVNFPTQVNASGTVTVNGNTYEGTGNLIINATANSSTLTDGLVTLPTGSTVTTTAGNKITTQSGDGLTVTTDGSNVIIDGITFNDVFKVDDETYKVSSNGLINMSGNIWQGKTDPVDGLTVDALTLASNWLRMVQAKDGALSVDDTTLANGQPSTVVNNLTDPTIIYGSLNRADDGTYSVTKDVNNTFASIEVDGVKLFVANNLSDVPISTLNPDSSKTVLGVTTDTRYDSFIVDATDNIPTVDNVNAIEISSGKIKLLDGQTITQADGASDVEVYAGNGTFNVGNETFTLADLNDDTLVKFSFDTQGNVYELVGFDKDSSATIDATTYIAPEDNAVLHYNDVDFWFFDGFAYDSFNVTVDANGNVLVTPGVRFSQVISSGRTLAEDDSITFAADISKTPVTVTNNHDPIIINDADDATLTGNFAKGNSATFSGDGVAADSLEDVAGTSFNLQNTQTLTAGDTSITANANDSVVGIGARANSISLDKSAQVVAPADIALTLNAGDYVVNGVAFTGSDTTSATTTADGVHINLDGSGDIAYDGMTLAGGASTIDNARGVTLAGGTTVTNAVNRAFTVNDAATIDDKIFNAAEPTAVTTHASGFDVGTREVTVEGDTDGYVVNLSNDDVSGLESVGASNGVTVDGLYNASVQTDKLGSFTTGDKSFLPDSSSVLYTFSAGRVASIGGADSIIGDFSTNINVNGDNIRVAGDNVSAVSVMGSSKGVTKIETGAAGTYEVSGKTYTIEDDNSFAFNMSSGKVSGIESLESGGLIVPQNESDLSVNGRSITLAKNRSPISLGIVDSEIVSVSGVNGTINGLRNATVYDVTNATINNKAINVRGSDPLDAIVANGVASSLVGLTDGATVRSAPKMTVTAIENGSFIFVDKNFTLEDTVDASFDFLTNEESRVAGIDRFAGSLSGSMAEGLTINGDAVQMIGDNLVIETDGAKITNISGLEDGGEISGDFGDATLKIPEGDSTVNGVSYSLEGDEGGASLSGNGSIISGLDKDSTLTFGAGGTFVVDGETLTLSAGDAVTSNLDGAYKINPLSPPISEKTQAEDVLNRSENSVYVEPTASGNVEVDLTGDNDLALIDSPDAKVKVTAGAGNDSVVVRHGASVEVALDEEGTTRIIPTAGQVTLENYNGKNAQVQTFDYSDPGSAIKSNDIQFGNGVMTVGDAIITYDPTASDTGATTADLYKAQGQRQPIGFTHMNGGSLDASTSDDSWLMKGNYAEGIDDTQKSGGSMILTGGGNDTILTGAGDYVDAGDGYNQIYLTDKALRNSVPEGATIVLGDKGYNTVQSFATGFAGDDDKILIKDLTQLGFGYDASNLIMSSGGAQITFANPAGDSSYEIKLTDGTNDYNAAVAKADSVLPVDNTSAADVFFGNENGISFSEYTGAVEVNLNEGSGTLDGREVKLFNIDKAAAGAGNTSLIGAAGTPNTLTGGTGNTSIWSNSGRDLMVGNTDENKSGRTTFYYMPGDGRDTITNFDFMTSAQDITGDQVQLDDFSGVTDVFLRGDDVVIGINNSADDYLTLEDAKGKSFRFNNDLIAKVDDNVEFDGFTNCYVGSGNNAVLTVGEGLGDVEVWLSDDSLEYHGTMYDNFRTVDASTATGNNILAGNELNNLIIGGAGANSMWGGYGSEDDTLVGGAGQNTFFFAAGNGHDVIQNAHDGDVVSLEDIYQENITRANITDGGAVIELTDGSTLEIQSAANIDYKLQDGSTYTVDRTNRQWIQK